MIAVYRSVNVNSGGENNTLEKAYYLPPENSGLAHVWSTASKSQDDYADFCCRGHNMIANAIIEGRKTGHMPSIKDLYKIAARVRRATAVLNQSHRDHYLQYGVPVTLTGTNDCVTDIIAQPEVGKRYGQFHNLAKIQGAAIAAMKDEDFAEQFGYAYHRTVKSLSDRDVIYISRENLATGQRYNVAALDIGIGKESVRFLHAAAEDQERMFAEADKHLQKILAQEPVNPKQFWEEMGHISLELFHAAPLCLGSQTATLMVLAGITKAMGFEVVPRKLETDHFIEAELTPYKHYVKDYGKKFIQPPKQSVPLATSIAVDDNFLKEAYKKTRERYHRHEPVEKLQAYIADCTGNYDSAIDIKMLEIKAGKMTVRVEPPEKQPYIEDALDFMGHQDVIRALDLPPGKYGEDIKVGEWAKKHRPPAATIPNLG